MQITSLGDLYESPTAVVVETLNTGLPHTVFPELAAQLDLSMKDLAGYLGMSPRTLRSRSASLTADEAERSYRAYRVFRRAIEVIGDEESARAWMNTSQRALGGKKPLDLLMRDVGAEKVLNILSGIEDGGYL